MREWPRKKSYRGTNLTIHPHLRQARFMASEFRSSSDILYHSVLWMLDWQERMAWFYWVQKTPVFWTGRRISKHLITRS